MSLDMMVDLETLGSSPRAAFTQLGIALFPAEPLASPEIHYHSQLYVDLDSCLRVGLAVDGSTIAWWLRHENRAAQLEMAKEGQPIEVVLNTFRQIVERHQPRHIWCRGPDFDIAILRLAHDLTGLKWPFKHSAGRDLRTLAEVFPVDYPERAGDETEHIAVHDAVHQATHLQLCLREKKTMTDAAEAYRMTR